VNNPGTAARPTRIRRKIRCIEEYTISGAWLICHDEVRSSCEGLSLLRYKVVSDRSLIS
jgi:hypothetical protein